MPLVIDMAVKINKINPLFIYMSDSGTSSKKNVFTFSRIFMIFLIFMGLGFGSWYIYDHFIDNGAGDLDGDYVPYEYKILGQNVSSFTYILQYEVYNDKENAVMELGDEKYDLIIMDAYFTNNPSNPWTAEDLDNIDSEENPKILLSYISIGEAESYRYYWDSSWDIDNDGIPDSGAPSWLDTQNPDWEGNYKVKYWELEWQNIIFGGPDAYVDRIMEQGFDGIYMDIIDAFEYYEEAGDENAGQEMVDFVGLISNYTKAKNPNFLIVPQNGESLAVDYPEYLGYVDGIGREDVLFNGDERNSEEDYEYVMPFLEAFRNADKFVLEVEYPTVPESIEECYIHAKENEFLCYVGPRPLDSIYHNQGFLPE